MKQVLLIPEITCLKIRMSDSISFVYNVSLKFLYSIEITLKSKNDSFWNSTHERVVKFSHELLFSPKQIDIEIFKYPTHLCNFSDVITSKFKLTCSMVQKMLSQFFLPAYSYCERLRFSITFIIKTKIFR